LWSRGKKSGPTFRAIPLFTLQGDLAGRRGQLPGRQGLAGRRPPLRRLAAARTNGRRAGGPNGGIFGGVLFEQPSGQFVGHGAGTAFALVEGDQLLLLVGIEHEFESGFGLVQPLTAELVAGGGVGSHGSPSWEERATGNTASHLTRSAQLQKRE
jgi:hypothetical protein